MSNLYNKSKEETLVILDQLETSKIEQIYSGKIGCMCGCKGTHHEDNKKFKRLLNNIKQFVLEGAMVRVDDEDREEKILYAAIEERNKCYAIYYK